MLVPSGSVARERELQIGANKWPWRRREGIKQMVERHLLTRSWYANVQWPSSKLLLRGNRLKQADWKEGNFEIRRWQNERKAWARLVNFYCNVVNFSSLNQQLEVEELHSQLSFSIFDEAVHERQTNCGVKLLNLMPSNKYLSITKNSNCIFHLIARANRCMFVLVKLIKQSKRSSNCNFPSQMHNDFLDCAQNYFIKRWQSFTLSIAEKSLRFDVKRA